MDGGGGIVSRPPPPPAAFARPGPPSVPSPRPPPPPPTTPFSPFAYRLRAYDSETLRIVPGCAAPPIVCASVARLVGSIIEGSLLDRDGAVAEARRLLESDAVIVGAHIAYDLVVLARECPDLLPLIFRALAEARVVDVLLLQGLDAIAGGHLGIDPDTGMQLANDSGKQTGRYSLWNVVWLVLRRDDAKDNNAWKMSYGLLRGIPHGRWPRSARQYPVDDVRNPLEVAISQLGLVPGRTPHRNVDNLPEQVETAFDLQLGGAWGIRTDRARVTALRVAAQAKREVMTRRYQVLGFLRADGTEDQAAVKRAVASAYGAVGTCSRCGGSGRMPSSREEPCRGIKVRGRYAGCVGAGCACGGRGLVRRVFGSASCSMLDGGCDGTGLDVRSAPTLSTITTPTGRISISRDTLSESGDEDLHDYGESEHDKVLDTYLPFLEQGLERPINLDPNALLETTRASYRGVIQLIPTRLGVRECFVARDGYDFCSVDFSALELCTLSQLCLWTVKYSRMAEVINRTRDPGMLHTAFGARMIGVTVEEMVAAIKAKDPRAKNTRQAAKVGNFSFGGGAGAATTVLTNRARSKGTTKAPDGFEYAGIRFCILLDGAERCGEHKVMEWGSSKRRQVIPPTCLRCLRVVQDVLRPSWYAEWPEMQDYFAWVTKVTGTKNGARGSLPCFGRKFWRFDQQEGFQRLDPPPIDVVVVRGGVSFTDGANGGFQTLAAFGAKYALRCVTREAYTDRDSPLWGTRPIFFAHDEIFSEMPRDKSHLAGPRKALVMREAMKVYVPDVYIGAEPAIMGFWSKDADAVYRDGKLVRWEPKS